MTTAARGRRPIAELRRDPYLRALEEFNDLLITSARSALHRKRLRRAVGAPVTTASLTALRLIERQGLLTMSDIARRLELDQSTLSRQVRPLEREGLVMRSSGEGDRRVVRLTVTARGRRLLQRARDVTLNEYEVALSDWSPRDRALLAALLGRLRGELLHTRADSSG